MFHRRTCEIQVFVLTESTVERILDTKNMTEQDFVTLAKSLTHAALRNSMEAVDRRTANLREAIKDEVIRLVNHEQQLRTERAILTNRRQQLLELIRGKTVTAS
ncbi:hypothetical protein N3K66_008367 [Trichothecium roseum]|uniref:Uncharacterized protein n=1 Tax=Trichothecium roseum TaxID=47278 RepID=A0ACC0UQ05_9HYPO|nr:hypothetical protein N3K66_008367 [Trichothecium roseum]